MRFDDLIEGNGTKEKKEKKNKHLRTINFKKIIIYFKYKLKEVKFSSLNLVFFSSLDFCKE